MSVWSGRRDVEVSINSESLRFIIKEDVVMVESSAQCFPGDSILTL